ncbi:secreted protein [Melampsora americana]|nr:secreted protein [Melampsora americana]
MKYSTLLGSLTVAALSVGSSFGRSFLIRRDDDGSSSYPTKAEGTKSTDVIFHESTELYTKTVEVVQSSCDKHDTETIYSSMSTLETSIKTVEETTHQTSFDTSTATTYKSSVVQIIASYSSMVTVLSTYPDVENGCHESLKKITSYTQSIVDVYMKYGICLREDVESVGGFNQEAFDKLDLELDLKAQSQTKSEQTVPEDPSKPEEPSTEDPPQPGGKTDAEGVENQLTNSREKRI